MSDDINQVYRLYFDNVTHTVDLDGITLENFILLKKILSYYLEYNKLDEKNPWLGTVSVIETIEKISKNAFNSTVLKDLMTVANSEAIDESKV